MTPRDDEDIPEAGPGRTWSRYMEQKYRTVFRRFRRPVELKPLLATQSEIELLKYRMVSEEGFRIEEPIVVYRGRMGSSYIVDGHTRARVRWDAGEEDIDAVVLTCRDVQVDAELEGQATRAGGGEPMHIWEVPITDRLGEGSEAWRRRRRQLVNGTDHDPDERGSSEVEPDE